MADDIERELLEILNEPTVDKVRRDQAQADLLMLRVGRTLAPAVNARLADLAKTAALSSSWPEDAAKHLASEHAAFAIAAAIRKGDEDE